MPLRSILAGPAEQAALELALDSVADAVLLDLAACAGDRGDTGELVRRVDAAGKRAIVALSHPRTRMLHGDAEAAVSPGLYAVTVAAFEPQDVRDAAVALREFELARDIEPGAVALYPVITTARGLLRAAEIASAVPRVAGLVFDALAYADDIGARSEEVGARLSFARGQVIAAARARDAVPIVSGVALQFGEMARYGFAGAVITDPSRVAHVNDAFTPGEPALQSARADIAAYDEAREAGEWVASRDGRIVDAHRVRKARRLIDG